MWRFIGINSRDRLSFSKSILRRFIRDCVDRDAAVASPWIVKPSIAQRFGVNSVMPEETRKGVESIKKGEIDKRKKAWEEKEGPPTKKQKKMTAAQEERGENFLFIDAHMFAHSNSLQQLRNGIEKLAIKRRDKDLPKKRLSASLQRRRRKNPSVILLKIWTSGF